MHRKASYLFVILFVAMAIVCVAAPAARADEVSHARVVRLSFVEGDVAYQRAGATWQRAMMNQPIQQDFSLRTDAGYAEVEFETGLVIRLAQHTQLDFTELSMIDGRKVTRLKLDEGTIITTANLSHNDELSVAAGNVDVTVPRNGRFRVDATESQNWVTVFHGKVEVASGQTTKEVESGKTLHADGASSALSVDASPEADAFDKWVTDRDKAEQTSQSNASQYVSQQNYSYNVADLYNYGLWYNMPGYGMVWQPYGMGAGWMPFGNGLWMMGDPGMGWMWTSYEPWGWLPYHYGGWVNLAGGGWVLGSAESGNISWSDSEFRKRRKSSGMDARDCSAGESWKSESRTERAGAGGVCRGRFERRDRGGTARTTDSGIDIENDAGASGIVFAKRACCVDIGGEWSDGDGTRAGAASEHSDCSARNGERE